MRARMLRDLAEAYIARARGAGDHAEKLRLLEAADACLASAAAGRRLAADRLMPDQAQPPDDPPRNLSAK